MVENQRVGYIICHCIVAGLQNIWFLILKEYVYVYSEFYYTLMSTAPVLTYLQLIVQYNWLGLFPFNQ